MSLTAVVFIFAFAVGGVLALVRHPIYGLMTYVGVFYLHPPSRWWGQGIFLDIRWSFIAAGVTVLAILLHKPSAPQVPMLRSGAFWGFLAFVIWIALQSLWALATQDHAFLLSMYINFLIVIFMVCRSIETEQHLRLFLWAHVLGCFYLGWVAYSSYDGGRFESFGGPGIGEANAGALQLATGILVAGSLMLAGSRRFKLLLLCIIPIIVNALVTTISRSGFLSIAFGGLLFNLFTPVKYRKPVRVLSVLALVLFALLTNPMYWARIGSIKYKGQEIEGIDTGGGRLVIIREQWHMFEAHPMGCGHMCTTVLSPAYLDESRLSAGARASHNTFMTMLVDHGIVGGVFYVAMVVWILLKLRVVASRLKGDDGFLATVLPAVAGVLGAITIADMFVQYPKFEARVWFVSLVIVLLHFTERKLRQGPDG